MKIELKGEVKPLKVNVPRDIPILMRDPAKNCANCMEELLAEGVVEIVPAGKPSLWCSPAFFILKRVQQRARHLADQVWLAFPDQ